MFIHILFFSYFSYILYSLFSDFPFILSIPYFPYMTMRDHTWTNMTLQSSKSYRCLNNAKRLRMSGSVRVFENKNSWQTLLSCIFLNQGLLPPGFEGSWYLCACSKVNHKLGSESYGIKINKYFFLFKQFFLMIANHQGLSQIYSTSEKVEIR